jgi:peptide/nickel transport system permease protein
MLILFSPGYLSDAREMDARFAGAARLEMTAEARRSDSIGLMLAQEFRGWVHADLGSSRQYGVPVSELLIPRLAVTGKLMLSAILFAWATAAATSIASSLGSVPSPIFGLPSTALLAVPAAALGTICLIFDSGGPVLVMTVLLAARDFKFLNRVLRQAWREPHVQYARALGIGRTRLLAGHVLPHIAPQLFALVTLSLLTALSVVVPVEVIFSVPGVGQLAWNAAMNRDLPVLVAVAAIMAMAVTVSGLIAARSEVEWQATQ